MKKKIIIEFIKNIDIKIVVWMFFKKVYYHHKLFLKIILNQKKIFINRFWKQVCQILEIIWWLSTTYHSKTDDLIKHVNQIIKAYFWMFVNYIQDNWAALTLSAQLAINNHNIIFTDMSFFFLSHDYHLNSLNFTEESENRKSSNLIKTVKWMLCKFRKIIK